MDTLNRQPHEHERRAFADSKTLQTHHAIARASPETARQAGRIFEMPCCGATWRVVGP
jgi:hypothetical protein